MLSVACMIVSLVTGVLESHLQFGQHVKQLLRIYSLQYIILYVGEVVNTCHLGIIYKRSIPFFRPIIALLLILSLLWEHSHAQELSDDCLVDGE